MSVLDPRSNIITLSVYCLIAYILFCAWVDEVLGYVVYFIVYSGALVFGSIGYFLYE
jgi:hypothetical protein